jgi:MYXO-CTERM domain-containing protein
VRITFPTDQQQFALGNPFVLQVEATDASGIQGVDVYLNNTPRGPIGQPPYQWEIRDLPEGAYTAVAAALDLAGNQGLSPAVGFAVGNATPPPPSSSSGGTGGPGLLYEDEGCGCHSGGKDNRAGFMLLVLVPMVAGVRLRRPGVPR